jgi:erythronate-4-phosphate dehydrogenase
MEKKLRFVADSAIPYLDILRDHADCIFCKASDITPEVVRDADALFVRTRTFCDAALLRGSRVSLVASATIGTDHIDTEWCSDNGLQVVSAPGCNSLAVRQYLFTALYALAQRKGISLQGLTLGVIGVGNVGSKVADFGRRLGFRVLCNDPPKESLEPHNAHLFTPLDQLLAQSDIVTLHIPLWKENRGFADGIFFEDMKEKAIFVNTSRGEVVCEDALLRSMPKFAGVVADVGGGEPDINRKLLEAVDIATPHIAGYSRQGKINGSTTVVRAAGEHFSIDALKAFVIRDDTAVVRFDPEGLSQKEICDRLCAIYDIWKDDRMLRSDPGKFEQIRSHYNYRTEF